MVAMNKGVILISHDIHVVQACHKVLFLHDKKVEMNTHKFFMENSEAYRQMIEMRKNNILEEEE